MKKEMSVRINLVLSDRLYNQRDFPDCQSWIEAEKRENGPVKFILGRSVEDDDEGLEGPTTPVLRLLIISSKETHATIARHHHIYDLNSAGFIACIGTKPEVYGGSESLSGEFPNTSSANSLAQEVITTLFSSWPAMRSVTLAHVTPHGEGDSPLSSAEKNPQRVRLSSLSEEYDRCGRKRSWAARRLSKRK